MTSRFYMCLAENGSHPPTVRHANAESVTKEAERLARALGGGKVHVLVSIATVEKDGRAMGQARAANG